MSPMTNSDRIYWDHNSTTPCVAEVLAEMLPYFAVEYGNSGSPHNAGRVAASAVAEARDRVAHAIGTDSENVVFTSGATESNNLAILGIADHTTGVIPFAKQDSKQRSDISSEIALPVTVIM